MFEGQISDCILTRLCSSRVVLVPNGMWEGERLRQHVREEAACEGTRVCDGGIDLHNVSPVPCGYRFIICAPISTLRQFQT